METATDKIAFISILQVESLFYYYFLFNGRRFCIANPAQIRCYRQYSIIELLDMKIVATSWQKKLHSFKYPGITKNNIVYYRQPCVATQPIMFYVGLFLF